MAKIDGTNNGEVIDALDGVTNGPDVIFGRGGKDTIYGLGGNDVLKGGGGADKLNGGDGTDTADYSDSDEGVQVSLAAGAGAGGTADGDKLFEIENLAGSAYDDTLQGDENANSLYGEAGNDVLKGAGGADKLYGGAGDDLLNSDSLGDFLDGGTGDDTANFSEAQGGVYVNLSSCFYKPGVSPVYPGPNIAPNIFNVENVSGSNQPDNIHGDDADNILIGNGGVDRLYGWYGNDTLDGGDGNDLVEGAAGNDLLTGGADDDRFVYNVYGAGPPNFGNDIITDFTDGEDVLDIDDAIFADFADVQANMQQAGNDVVITFDANNTITLQNVNIGSLSASDFLFS
jgi:Ca2+-binding RTX toxin-like protein